MSDRYYAQMVDYLKISPWELMHAHQWPLSDEAKALEKKLMPKVTRKDLSNELKEVLGTTSDMSKFPMESLIAIIKQVKSKKVVPVALPSGRLKAPYFAAINTALGLETTPIELSTATVALMKELLERLNEKSCHLI